MKLYQGNPRTITKRRYQQLQETLDELGDLGGAPIGVRIYAELERDEDGKWRITTWDLRTG